MNKKFLIIISIFLVVIIVISAVSIIWWMGRPEGTTDNKHEENVIDPNIIENRTFGINKRINDDSLSSNQSSPAIAIDQKEIYMWYG